MDVLYIRNLSIKLQMPLPHFHPLRTSTSAKSEKSARGTLLRTSFFILRTSIPSHTIKYTPNPSTSPATRKITAVYFNTSLAGTPVIASKGKAQNGWSILVSWSP
jgi:hypothetical protein